MIYRKSIKIPLSASCKTAAFIQTEQEFYYRLDIFYHKNWKNKNKRPIILHFTGAGMKGPYTVESPMVKRWIDQNFIFCCVYYYHQYFKDLTWNIQDKKTSRLTDAPYTQQPYWCENFSLDHDYHHHLRARAYMIESTLEYIVDHCHQFKFAPFNIEQVFFTSKSRGGIAAIVWSALSSCREWKKYQSYCKGIINSCGFVGSDELHNKVAGWKNFKNSVQVLSYYLANTQHIFYHAYNEKDIGNNDLSRRLMYIIPKSSLNRHYFTNFTNSGHVSHMDYNLCAVQAIMNQTPCKIQGKTIKNLEEILLNTKS